jgi:hypothetical protein
MAQNNMNTEKYYTLTVRPGFSDFEEPISRYVKRDNYGSDMTIYTIDNEISALLAKKRLENEGYIIHLERPDGSMTTTKYDVVYSGITIKQS